MTHWRRKLLRRSGLAALIGAGTLTLGAGPALGQDRAYVEQPVPPSSPSLTKLWEEYPLEPVLGNGGTVASASAPAVTTPPVEWRLVAGALALLVLCIFATISPTLSARLLDDDRGTSW